MGGNKNLDDENGEIEEVVYYFNKRVGLNINRWYKFGENHIILTRKVIVNSYAS